MHEKDKRKKEEKYKKIVIHYPLSKKEELFKTLETFALNNERFGSLENVVRFYIEGRYYDLKKEEIKILKAKKKFQRLKSV